MYIMEEDKFTKYTDDFLEQHTNDNFMLPGINISTPYTTVQTEEAKQDEDTGDYVGIDPEHNPNGDNQNMQIISSILSNIYKVPFEQQDEFIKSKKPIITAYYNKNENEILTELEILDYLMFELLYFHVAVRILNLDTKEENNATIIEKRLSELIKENNNDLNKTFKKIFNNELFDINSNIFSAGKRRRRTRRRPKRRPRTRTRSRTYLRPKRYTK